MCVPVAWRKSAELSRFVSGLVVFGALFIQFRACHFLKFVINFHVSFLQSFCLFSFSA